MIKKGKLHAKLIFLTCCILIAIILCVVFFQRNSSNGIAQIEERWNLVLPQNVEYIYKKKTPASFHGDGFRYHVFQLSSSSVSIGNLSDTSNETMEKKMIEVFDLLEVPDTNRPNFQETYQWKKIRKQNNTLFLIIDNHFTLYLLEVLK